jgi:hypothetical protein
MTLIVRLIAKYALWIYILCGLGMIAYLRAALAARKEGIYAIFSLERARFAKKVYRSAGMIFVLFLVVVGVYALSHYVELPPAEAAVSETPIPSDKESTPVPTFTSPLTPPRTQATMEPTPTRRPRTTVIVLPTVAAQETVTSQATPADCPHGNVQVLQPGQNQVINEGIQVKGTANKQNFDRYEFKFQSRDFEDEWHWVQTFTAPVQNGDLGIWSTAHLPAGNYRFMLIVIDKTGNSQECVVPVIIQH